MRMLLTGVMALFLAGCEAPALRDAALAQSVTVETSMFLSDPDTLVVTYTPSAPVPMLALRRTADDSRLSRWKPVNPDIEIIHLEDRDYIRRKDRRRFGDESFEVPATYVSMPKDYAPFMPFRDGGLLIHSGRFQACPVDCRLDGAPDSFAMTLSPLSGGRVILHGAVSDGPVSWTDRHDGTMVYIGAGEPVETPDLIAVLDAELPGDIRAALDEFFPRLMQYYAARLGRLPEKPMLFAALDRHAQPDGNPDSNNYSSQGGTLPGQVFMHLVGDGWFEDQAVREAQTAGFLPWFFAHEAGHLYQRMETVDFDMGESWIHEGGADAFAALTARELGAVEAQYLSFRINDAVAQCLRGLEGGSLADAGERGAFDLYYACGMVIQLMADEEIRARSGGDQDLFDLWTAFLDDIEAGAPWTGETFLGHVGQMAGPEVLALSRRIIAGDTTLTPEELLARLPMPA